MPYAGWLLDVLEAWGEADPMEDAWEFDWRDVDGLLGAAAEVVSWAEPLGIVPLNAHEALIVLDLPDGGPRLCSLTEEIDFYGPPTAGGTVADAVWHALTSVRATGAALVAQLDAVRPVNVAAGVATVHRSLVQEIREREAARQARLTAVDPDRQRGEASSSWADWGAYDEAKADVNEERAEDLAALLTVLEG
ncbi:hypothetical protein [Streptomyces nanshensis]|uniref:hypothetical protein n=1 Tax=Streptomyces nanshensis TaxID=518642 RepID=UPI00085CD1AE|nr:hypothetical protein [Streptomyces nanshensis]